MIETSEWSIPLYSLLLKDASGCVLLRGGQHIWLPIFTSHENAHLYVKRASVDCLIVELPTWDAVVSFLRKPPSRNKSDAPSVDTLVVDPIAPKGDEWLLFDRNELLNMFETSLNEYRESQGSQQDD